MNDKLLLEEEKFEGNDKTIDWVKRKKLYSMFLYVCIFINFDTGAVPVALEQIRSSLSINYEQTAAIASFVNLGISVMCLFVAFFLRKFSAKKVLAVNLILNCIFCWGFVFAYNITIVYVCRFFMGMTQSFWIVYAPIWTNLYSPLESSTTWVGILQGFSPLGIIFGYMITGILITNFTNPLMWRVSIAFQAAALIPPFFYLLFCQDNRDIDILYKLKKKKEVSASIGDNDNNEPEMKLKRGNSTFEALDFPSFKKNFMFLLKNSIFWLTVLGLTSFFYIVYGVQFWATTYFEKVINLDPKLSMVLYSVLTITAPVFGVIFGGKISDRIGGYKRNMKKSLKLCVILCFIGSIFAVLVGFLYQATLFSMTLWLAVFFGASVVPPATGIIISCVHLELQSVSSSIAQLLYNLGGYFLAPIVSGLIIDSVKDQNLGLIWGFRATLYVCILGFFFLLLSYFSFDSFKKKNPDIFKESKENDMDLN